MEETCSRSSAKSIQIQKKVDEKVGRGNALDCGGYHLLIASVGGIYAIGSRELKSMSPTQ